MLNQIAEHVQAIQTAIADDTVHFGFRTGVSPKDCCADGKRRVIFVIPGGEHGRPYAKGNVQVEEDKFAKALTGPAVEVMVHIIAESATATAVLWSNVVNASHDSLGFKASEPGEFDFNPDPEAIDGFEFGGIRHIVQSFTWRFHMFHGITPLPDPCSPVTNFIATGDLAPLANFTHTGTFTDE